MGWGSIGIILNLMSRKAAGRGFMLHSHGRASSPLHYDEQKYTSIQSLYMTQYPKV
jgi:hypothetical protein